MSNSKPLPWKTLSCLVLVFSTVTACHRDKPPQLETKTHYCHQLAHRMHDISWEQPDPGSYHTSLDQQRLQREWLRYDCDNVLK